MTSCLMEIDVPGPARGALHNSIHEGLLKVMSNKVIYTSLKQRLHQTSFLLYMISGLIGLIAQPSTVQAGFIGYHIADLPESSPDGWIVDTSGLKSTKIDDFRTNLE